MELQSESSCSEPNPKGENESETADTEEQVDTTPTPIYTELEMQEKVLDLVRAAPPAKNKIIDLNSSLEECKIDSLEKLSVAMDLEEWVGIWISDETIEGFQTVRDFSDYLVAQGLAKTPDAE